MPQTPLKEHSVTPDLASKLSVSSGSAALPFLRGSLENEEDAALAGFAILVGPSSGPYPQQHGKNSPYAYKEDRGTNVCNTGIL